MKLLSKIYLYSFLVLLLTACADSIDKHVIGISQCSEDAWRTKLRQELEMTACIYSDVELRYAVANDDSQVQEQQIDSLVASGIDLLIVSPNQVDNLTDAIDRAYDKGIPVILYDRKTNSGKYSTFMGADNREIGVMLGRYAKSLFPQGANVVEIKGKHGSSPAKERHEGFISVMPVVASATGDWTEESGAKAMKEILANYNGTIDCIMGGNDRMAVGALRELKQQRPEDSPVVLGVDALPSEDGGMALVRDSILNASAIYPTHGDELLTLALDILDGKKLDKEKTLQTSIVTPDNASILLLQNQEVVRQSENLKKMYQRVDNILRQLDLQKLLLFIVVAVFFIVMAFLTIVVRAYRKKHELSQRLMKEKEIVETQRDELELERDRIIEATLKAEESPVEDEEQKTEEILIRDKEFIDKFNKYIAENMINSDLSVEDIGRDLGMSRVQLYRKVKVLTGYSPVEMLRKTRLAEAKQLLKQKSGNISEIAYQVGFSTPSYFTKCFKKEYGILPGDV